MAYAPWRDYCDAIHSQLISNWVAGQRFSCSLKTDLFDESVGNGCLKVMASISNHVHGMDISRQVVESAGAKNPQIKTLVGDVRDIPFEDGAFEFIFSNSTIDHFNTLGEIEQSIQEMARVLAGNGKLILTLDNPWNPVVALRNRLPQNLIRRAGLIPYFMGRTLSMSALVQAVEDAGLKVQRRCYIQHAPRVVALHLCHLLSRKGSKLASLLISTMVAMERLSNWPSAAITGHYSALLATKKSISFS